MSLLLALEKIWWTLRALLGASGPQQLKQNILGMKNIIYSVDPLKCLTLVQKLRFGTFLTKIFKKQLEYYHSPRILKLSICIVKY